MSLDFKTKLIEILEGSTITDDEIDNVIQIISEQQPGLSPEEQLEEMINFLIISGDSTLQETTEGAGASCSTIAGPNINKLLSVFPDISPSYLKDFCDKHQELSFNEIVEELSEIDYIKAEKDPLDIWEHLKQMLPNADPTYLRNHARVLATRPPEELQEFVANAIDNNDYPTLQEYYQNLEIRSDVDLYLNKFSIVAYLEKVPNPLDFLENDYKSKVTEEDLKFAGIFMQNQFLYHRKNEIDKVFRHYNMDLIKACNRLKYIPKAFRKPRTITQLPDCQNFELLKEVAFLKHEKEIRHFLKQKDEKYKTAFMDAQQHGLLQTCLCCYDDQLIPEECYFCNKKCVFCKECVKRGAEHVIGKEETEFPCLADCNSIFSYPTLQTVLDKNTFEKLCHRKQIEDIKNANIDGLEKCPYCDFCMIPSENDKIFKCRNIECMAETCRGCWHKAHIPLRCNEIEYDEDVKMRTYIEDKMTEALLRQCKNCPRKFYKESGCNKMTCVCGAKMCYLCGASINGYSHFGSGSKCPLYTENLEEYHRDRVRKGANVAKEDLGVNVEPGKLKFDPTRGLN